MRAGVGTHRRLVLITGASSGIGQALAAEYVARGWRVALVARRQAALQDWIAQQGWSQEQACSYGADVRRDEDMAEVARQCLAHQGLPDVVIANAGISVGVDLRYAEDLGVLRDLYETNVLGVAATFQPFIEPMVARGQGALVGIASVAAARGLPGHAGYCGTKAAVVQMCETLRGELAPAGVRVVTLAPGYVATPLTQDNDYPMPFLMRPEVFARQAVNAIERGVRFKVIPWQMGVVYALLRALPRALFDALVGAQTHRKKRRRP
ncbi:MAG TPA: SDR family oxidoreductase [Aquabacterium sp.]|uniref:SDR family oxidoreductase n=1 Tax=Aquabacterium sp. TaxID=1872578 RepID=UPI002E37A391|nr:SDR family oxidoreductase [Aquabacterium sp.]HEX5373917.1 SDR family oxidoreductase [Aquabacterium sp.]